MEKMQGENTSVVTDSTNVKKKEKKMHAIPGN
jgi:hypothetical protein